MQNNYLEHHGILGMRWGVRRYQNPDGTYTSLGKKRKLRDQIQSMSDDDLRKAIERKRLEKRYDELSPRRYKKNKNGSVVDAALDATSKTAKLVGNKDVEKVTKSLKTIKTNTKAITSKTKNSSSKKAKLMSDDELRRIVNRLDLERQYTDITYDKIKSGSDYVRESLEIIGASVALLSGGIQIYKFAKEKVM